MDFLKGLIPNLNKQQVYAILKGLLVGGGPLAVVLSRVFHFDNATISAIIEIGGSVLSLYGLILLGTGSTDKNLVLDAKSIEGVQVHVDTSRDPDTNKLVAPESVVKLAEGPTTDVFPMIGGPRVPSDHEVTTETLNPPAQSPPNDGGYKTL